ncbi:MULTISPECIES: polysaccharide deacetylase family protein [Paenibacillus]|uniref:polysaccharide deacetylase family protein n=1 Tax=Paenibacillus TaxID=44249 RepID=UPI002FE04A11
MVKKKQGSALDVRRKNTKKLVKTLIQSVILVLLGVVLFHAVFDVETYQEPDRAKWQQQGGFIALSYFGVGRSGTSKLVDKSDLDEQLRVLHDLGYQTISQQDIMNFYTKGKPLPDKALFLSFEDGRNDSSLFARPMLEKYNFKATFFSYADKLGDNKERKFVQPEEMKKMEKTGFWEMGTNGYRLSYINVFDNDGRFIGMKNENELRDKSNVAYYNHYLMDFIRDENMIPAENRDEMNARISADYENIQGIYTKQMGYVPSVYMIMHANALGEGMNRLVTEANQENIRQLFQIHFNREGEAYNSKSADILNLTRLQPAPYWSTNHLLMRLREDTGEALPFITGNEEDAGQWNVKDGAAQFKDHELILTSPPGRSGWLELKEPAKSGNLHFSAKVTGNVVGKQSIYVRYDRAKDSYIRVTLDNNTLQVEQKKSGADPEVLLARKLDAVSWSSEDLSFDKASVYTYEQTSAGVNKDDDAHPININDERQVDISLDGGSLTVRVDDEAMLDKRQIDDSIRSGTVAVEAEYNEKNKKENIYDARFENMEITAGDQVLFSNAPHGWQGAADRVKAAVNAAVDWAIETF